MERAERIRELVEKKLSIDAELASLRKLAKEEKAAFNVMRKPRKKRQEATSE